MQSIKHEQEILSKMLELANVYASRGEYDLARRAMVCAVAKMLEVASGSDILARESMERRAIELVKNCVEISERPVEESFICAEGEEIELPCPKCATDLFNRREERESVRIDNVVGLAEVKQVIKRQILYPYTYTDIYAKYGKHAGGGILLYGLPGTGKTMIAQAIANEIDAEFIPVRCSDIVSKWFGETEKNIKEIFEKAKKNKLSIIFFDEFEALGARRGKSETMKRVVPELLVQMQGLDGCDNIIVLAATNRPWDIDGAFMRPGRFTNRIYVALPDKVARLELLRNTFKGVPLDCNVRWEKFLERTEGYSGADIVELCDYAKNFAIEREIATGVSSCVKEEDILKATEKVKSSISMCDRREMEKYQQQL